MANRLALESSPYLLQHAQNPVEWYPWGEEALAKARAEDKPILVSIGYAACHWCHVMEHESFEDEAVAAVMNELLVCVKVDREERPDVDAVYMDAVQAMGVRGGWPLNVFLTPTAEPFYGLTYAPPQPWVNLLRSVDQAWRGSRAQLEESAAQFTAALNQDALAKFGPAGAAGPLAGAALEAAFYHFQGSFDNARGGTDRAPKFPMPAHYAWLLRYHARTNAARALDHTLLTLREMARGGIFDQAGGGWARYSVDADWLVPHFEKMLYDNGQLLTACAEACRVAPNPELRAAALATVAWLAREMRAPSGGLYASLDADSEGVEGKFYVWTAADFAAVFAADPADAAIAADYFRVSEAGSWAEESVNILHRRGADAPFAERHGLTTAALAAHADQWRAALLAARAPRPRPGLDDKLLTGWNGLALRGLCDTHRTFGDAQSGELARGVGDFLLGSLHSEPGGGYSLRRNLKPGGAPQPGFLEDYAAVADGLAALYQLTFEPRWLHAADGLLTYALAHFADPAQPAGLLFYTDSATPTPLIARKKEVFDNVIPASNSLLARALRTVGLLTANRAYLERARGLLATVQGLLGKDAGFLTNWAALYEELLTPGAEVVIVGPEAAAFGAEIGRHFLPGAVLAGSAEATDALPVLAGKTALNGRTTIYVCFEGACQQPVFTVAEAVQLAR